MIQSFPVDTFRPAKFRSTVVRQKRAVTSETDCHIAFQRTEKGYTSNLLSLMFGCERLHYKPVEVTVMTRSMKRSKVKVSSGGWYERIALTGRLHQTCQ